MSYLDVRQVKIILDLNQASRIIKSDSEVCLQIMFIKNKNKNKYFQA